MKVEIPLHWFYPEQPIISLSSLDGYRQVPDLFFYSVRVRITRATAYPIDTYVGMVGWPLPFNVNVPGGLRNVWASEYELTNVDDQYPIEIPIGDWSHNSRIGLFRAGSQSADVYAIVSGVVEIGRDLELVPRERSAPFRAGG
jgi:hypothetical protein